MEIRVRKGLSQIALARMSGVGSKTLSSFETVRRVAGMSLGQLVTLARALGVKPSELLCEGEFDR